MSVTGRKEIVLFLDIHGHRASRHVLDSGIIPTANASYPVSVIVVDQTK